MDLLLHALYIESIKHVTLCYTYTSAAVRLFKDKFNLTRYFYINRLIQNTCLSFCFVLPSSSNVSVWEVLLLLVMSANSAVVLSNAIKNTIISSFWMSCVRFMA